MKKLAPIILVSSLLAIGLTACSAGDPVPTVSKSPTVTATPSAKASPSKTATATPKPTATSTPKPTAAPSDESWNTVLNRPTKATVTWQASSDGDSNKSFPVEFTFSVSKVEKMSADEFKQVEEASSEESNKTFAAFDFYKISVDEKYVSGKDPKNQSSASAFYPIDGEGVQANRLPLIGFDWCESGSFGDDFVKGKTNSFCLVGAVAKGSPAPAGVEFAQDSTKYSASTGKPEKVFVKEQSTK